MTAGRDRGALALCLPMVQRALRRWRALLGVLATVLLQAALTVVQPWPMKILVDNVIGHQPLSGRLASLFDALPGGHTTSDLLTWAVVATVAVFLCEWIVGLVGDYANLMLGQRLQYGLAAEVFEHVQRQSLRFHTSRRVGDSMRRVTKDTECISTIVQGALIPAIAAVITVGSMVLIMWRLDASLTAIALLAVPLLVVALRRYGPLIGSRSATEQEVESGVYEIVEQTLSAMPAVQAFGREADCDRRLRGQCEAAVDAAVSLSNAELKLSVVAGLATAIATAGIFWVGGHQALSGHLTVGTILVFTSYLTSLYAPLDALIHASSTVHGAAGSANRVLEVLEADPEVADLPGAPPLSPVRGHVRFEDVTFGYDEGRPVLHDVSVDAAPGQTVAIVGPTGAGKSTLMSLVLRFFDPWSGRVTIDGVDLRQVQVASVRSQVGLVLQEPFLFPMSVADNIAYGRPGASRAEVEAAARAANAHEFISELAEGYDTLIGERGATLSGGERQRLSIARALLRNAPVLILDEPTSALDAGTEALLLEALDRLMAGRTTFVIAHRFSTIRRADQIVVLEHGRVVETGSHGELLDRAGLYARLHELQAVGQ